MSQGEGIEVCRTVGTLIVKIRTQSDTMYQHPEIRHNDKGFYCLRSRPIYPNVVR